MDSELWLCSFDLIITHGSVLSIHRATSVTHLLFMLKLLYRRRAERTVEPSKFIAIYVLGFLKY